jgi:hypothetical protein
MKYLLETSVFLWALAIPEKLNRQARDLLSNEREGLFLSAASSSEISPDLESGNWNSPRKVRPKVDVVFAPWISRIFTPSRSEICHCITRTLLIAFQSCRQRWKRWCYLRQTECSKDIRSRLFGVEDELEHPPSGNMSIFAQPSRCVSGNNVGRV